MHSRKLGTAFVLLALAAAPIVAAPAASDARVTVGQFATQLVAALGRDAHDMNAVRAALKSLGGSPDFDASATLTTGAAARLATGLGVSVELPRDGELVVTQARASAMVASIASMHVDRTTGIRADEGPTQCLSSDNRGACVNCCKEASGLGGQFCGHYCHANVPPPVSPGEPQP